MDARPRRSVLAGVVTLALFPAAVRAQIPDEFTNLEVLPEDISRAELIATMRGFALGLGVR